MRVDFGRIASGNGVSAPKRLRLFHLPLQTNFGKLLGGMLE
jgi:hypothetical protein